MKKLIEKRVSIMLVLVLLIGLFAATPLSVYADDLNTDGYDDGDVAIIDAIIANHGLPWTPNDPASWPVIVAETDIGVSWTDTGGRIDALILYGLNLSGSLNLAGLTSLGYLDCESNAISVLDISNNPALTVLECTNNQLTALDVSQNPGLTAILCGNNAISSLDVSDNPALGLLSCWENQLTTLDVSQNPSLALLACESNAISSLDISNNPALEALSCSDNQLTALDVSQNPGLTVLTCDYNAISLLDISHNPALEILACNDNQLTTLDVSQNPALTGLNCYNNSMPQNEGRGVTGIANVAAFTAWGASIEDDMFVYSPQNGPMLTTPSFSAHPATQTVTENATLTFTAAASGNPAPTLYWEVSVDGGATWSVISDSDIYSGAASAALTLVSTPLSYNTYQYRCIATNSEGLVASNAAVLTVNAAAGTPPPDNPPPPPSDSSATATASGSPQTGDEMDVALWILLLVASAIGLCIVVLANRRRSLN